MTRSSEIETPSGKDVAYENFPVGSWLLPRRLRPHVACFYRFARAADDIADNTALAAEEKIARLDRFGDALTGREVNDPACETAYRMCLSLAETGVKPDHCADLLRAFRQDAIKLRYADWDDLLEYCRLSAAPVGRYLLDLHGGSRNGYAAADALCMALQVINHLQDCREDYLNLDRVYLPLDWLEAEGVSLDALSASCTSRPLRAVFDRTIAATRVLLTRATALPGGLASRRLAMESGATLAIAQRLIRLLERRDPLVRRVELAKSDFLVCCVRGALLGLVR
jgi:squalene synthase HpnC